MSGHKLLFEKVSLDEISSIEEKKNSTKELKKNSTIEVKPITYEDIDYSKDTAKTKRGYYFKPSTIEKLNKLKMFIYTDNSLESIVEDAINILYESKKAGR